MTTLNPLERHSRGNVFLQAAVLSDMTITGDDNAISIIRIVDIFRFSQPPSDAVPGSKPGVLVKLTIILKSVDYSGESLITVVLKDPANKALMTEPIPITFSGETRLRNAVIHYNVAVGIDGDGGVYQFEIYSDEELLSIVPWLAVQSASEERQVDNDEAGGVK